MKQLDFIWNSRKLVLQCLFLLLASCNKPNLLEVEESEKGLCDKPNDPVELAQVSNLKGRLFKHPNYTYYFFYYDQKAFNEASIYYNFDFYKLKVLCPCGLPENVNEGDSLIISGRVVVNITSLNSNPLLPNESACDRFEVEAFEKIAK